MMNYDIVHSGVARRQNVTQINTAVNQHAIANAVVSAEFTGRALKLFALCDHLSQCLFMYRSNVGDGRLPYESK